MTFSERMDKRLDEQAISLHARAEGAFVAFASGDALGWPQEFPSKFLGDKGKSEAQLAFRRWTRRGGQRFYAYEEPIEEGEYSDDTQLMLAVARCRPLPGKAWWNEFTRVELPFWTLYARGAGGATKRAADSWLRGCAPWKARGVEERHAYFSAGGNGAAMRVLPHAVFYASHAEPDRLLHDVAADSAATHGHPRALVGAAVYAFAAWSLLRTRDTLSFGELVDEVLQGQQLWSEPPSSGEPGGDWLVAADETSGGSYVKVWRQVVGEMQTLVEMVRDGLKAGVLADDIQILRKLGCFGDTKGAGTVSAAAALYECARYAAQPIQTVLASAFVRGADTDTLAAMSGGLVGCLNGREWLPPDWLNVQDSAYLRHVAAGLTRNPDSAGHQTLRSPIGMRELQVLESSLWRGQPVEDLAGLGSTTTVEPSGLKTLVKNAEARRLRIATAAGQTLYITKVARKRERVISEGSKEHLYVGRNDALVFAKRTLANLDHVLEAAREKGAVHPVTQLANSLLGLVIFPYEKVLVERIQEKQLSTLRGWPTWDIKLDERDTSKKTRTLGMLLWHLRNAAAHGRLTFSSDSGDRRQVRLIVEDKPSSSTLVNWRAEISAADLETFCRKLAELIDAELG